MTNAAYKYYVRKKAPHQGWEGKWWVYHQLWKGAYILPLKGFETWREAMDFVSSRIRPAVTATSA